MFVTRQFNISPALRIFDSNFRALRILHRHFCAPPPVHTTLTAVTSAPLHHLKKVSSLFCINITSKSESTRRHRGKVSPRGGTALAPSISLEISHSRAAARRPIYHPAIKSTHYHIQRCTTRRRQLPLSYVLSN